MTIANVPNISTASSKIATSAVKADSSVKTSFSSIMGQTSMGQYANAGQKQMGNVASADTSKNSNSNDSSQNVRQNSDAKKLSTAKESTQRSDKQDKVETTDVKNTSESTIVDETVVMDEVQEVVASAINQIKNQIMELFHIDENQLNQAMESLELEPVDLLKSDNVLQIVLNQAGFDNPVELLNNEELSQMTKGLMEIVSQMHQVVEEVQPELLVASDVVNNMETVNESIQPIVDEVPTTDVMVEGVKVSVETDSSTANDFSQQYNGREEQSNQNPTDVIANNSQTVFDNLTQAVSQTQTVSYTSATQSIDIVNQIVEEIRTVVKADTTTMEVQLNPESLGKVNISVSSREGIVTAHITAQTEAAKGAIESQIATLKETFQNQGLKVEAVEVSISPRGFGMEQEQSFNEQQKENSSKAKKQIHLEDDDFDESTLSEEESITVDMMRRSGNRVDFSA